VEYLEAIKADRLRELRLTMIKGRMATFLGMLKQYFSTRPTAEILPIAADFCYMEPFRSLIIDTPGEVDITRNSFDEHLDQLPALTTRWLQACKEQLIRLTPSNTTLEAITDDDSARLDLATTFFRCKWCTDPVSYPRVLEHRCIVGARNNNVEDSDPDSVFIAACGALGSGPWNYGNDQLEFEEEASSSARGILTACGVDPDTTTAATMNMMDHRIECLRCSNKSGRLVMRWKTAACVFKPYAIFVLIPS
jgi:hypothetical protein